ncbi:hypothetical protein HPB49_023162 [Dermacentor silvarum]|uniref:Uncharacterized protein n=1 Tax=Dermacentor silvarum TaxID=543639 RepID=A0ACB8DLB3_DERSI|nr:hypothetical protein HPB49_023162 [Dermacentor silvarum]
MVTAEREFRKRRGRNCRYFFWKDAATQTTGQARAGGRSIDISEKTLSGGKKQDEAGYLPGGLVFIDGAQERNARSEEWKEAGRLQRRRSRRLRSLGCVLGGDKRQQQRSDEKPRHSVCATKARKREGGGEGGAGSAGGGVTLSAEPSCCSGAADDEGDGGDPAAEPLEEAACFYGAVSRETAEWILWERGCADGLYLLRRSGPDYVLSLCFDRSVLHYRIRRLAGAGVELCGLPGQQFRDPWALLEGVQGLATRPSLPCNRARDAMLPPTHWGLSDDTVRAFMLLKARQWGMDEQQLEGSPTPPSPQGVRPEGSPGPGDLRSLLSKTLHEIQPWFHGPLSRADAERRLQDAGHLDGRFLVRERDDSSYALCLSHGGSVKHYKVDVTPSGEFAIQDGQRFPSIMSLISHYTLFSDGLWCPLTEACVRPDCHLAAKPTTTASRAEQRRSFAATTTTTARTGILNRLVASITPQVSGPEVTDCPTDLFMGCEKIGMPHGNEITVNEYS